MSKVDALKTKYALPETVVLKPMSSGFTQRFSDSGAVWLCAEPFLLVESDQNDTSPDWQARCGNATATPVIPNTGNSQNTVLASISCLAFRSRLNCGYCIPNALTGDGPFSIAIIYAPSIENEPRSLVTVNPVDSDNYLFLSERDNAVELTDKQGSFSLRHPVKQESMRFRLAIFSCTREGYALALDGQKPQREISPVETSADDATRLGASETSDLFIGCRSHRKGILKTLGEMFLADVFLWPDKDILALDHNALDTEISPERDLLMQYHTKVISRDI